MRIALFTETFLPKIDGIVNTLTYLMRHLEQRGHDCLIFAPEGGPSRLAHARVIGLPAYAFPLYDGLKIVPPHIDVLDMLQSFRPDVIHVVNPIAIGWIGMRHARQLGVPLLASYHTDIPGFAEKWGLEFLAEPIWAYTRWIHNQADLNLCPSRATMHELSMRGFERLAVWTRGVDTRRFSPDHRTAEWRSLLSDGEVDAPLLLSVGRLSAEKRIGWLKPILEALPGTRLAIVGDGPQSAELREVFSDTPTVFTGFLQGHDLACAYAAADAFVFPASNETFGNVMLEAMASGLPVVAARAGGPLDVIIDGQTGLFFDPESPDALLSAVRRLVLDPAYAHSMGATARRQAESRSWEMVLDGLLSNYLSLIQAPALEQVA
jgi:glycosyltransferase involved in cell wall biosynthesis